MQLRSTTREMRKEAETKMQYKFLITILHNTLKHMNENNSYCDRIRVIHEFYFLVHENMHILKKMVNKNESELSLFLSRLRQKAMEMNEEFTNHIKNKLFYLSKEDRQNRRHVLLLINDVLVDINGLTFSPGSSII